MSAVVVLIDNATGEIINAEKQAISGANVNEMETIALNVLPNPAYDYVNIANFASANNALFKFKATSNYGNNIYVDNINIGTASIEALTETSFNVYPNPASDLVNISFDLIQSNQVSVQILDITGKLVIGTESRQFNTGANKIELGTSELPQGMYFVQILTPESTLSTRLVIVK